MATVEQTTGLSDNYIKKLRRMYKVNTRLLCYGSIYLIPVANCQSMLRFFYYDKDIWHCFKRRCSSKKIKQSGWRTNLLSGCILRYWWSGSQRQAAPKEVSYLAADDFNDKSRSWQQNHLHHLHEPPMDLRRRTQTLLETPNPHLPPDPVHQAQSYQRPQ